jgi:hypothetical protein
MDVAQVFAALADLAPARREREAEYEIPNGSAAHHVDGWDKPVRATPEVDRLAATDALHRDQRLLRRAWGVVYRDADGVGKGAPHKAAFPLLSQPIRLERSSRIHYRIEPAGDFELSPLITDPIEAQQLEALLPPDLGAALSPETTAWLKRAAAAAGISDVQVVGAPSWRVEDAYVIAGTALYCAQPITTPVVADHLRAWSERSGLEETALASVYGTADGHRAPESAEPVESPLPLDPDQAAALMHARHEPVTVISGAPGCGKSHTLAAIALDAVARGQSVLMATQSVHAADVLGGLLTRQPGPTPVMFGDGEKRQELLTMLTSGASRARPKDKVRDAERAAAIATRIVRGLEVEAGRQLDLEAAALRAQDSDPVLFNDAPGLLDPDCNFAQVRELLERAQHSTGFLAAWRRRRAERKLRASTRSPLRLAELEFLLEIAADHRAAAELSATGGTDLTGIWERLAKADDAQLTAVGTALRHRLESGDQRGRSSLRAMSALGSALRAGRTRRRVMLAAMDAGPLLRGLPLWIGTVTDVEDLLPPVPAMFDLVILDEASHIDQLRAAPVLARARRAVVAGDPKQLRFVSFVSDASVDETVRRHGLQPLADRLDVRRNSAFDLAAGAAPVTMLAEHYRSVPHLIGFSAQRFYGGRVSTATRHPRNDSDDVIDVHHVDGGKAVDGVNAIEVDEALHLVGRLVADGASDLAVITPFRPQAEAIEAALLQRYSADEIVKHRLRAGTVHSFQGSEANTVIAPLGVHTDDSPARIRFAADAHLFNVLITRARHRLHVVTSMRYGDGLIGDFVQYAEQPPTPPAATDVDDWARRLAAELERAGATVRLGYPIGRWTVDICLGSGDAAFGVICGVHPHGTAAHIARQRVLRRVGWRLRDAFSSRYSNDPIRAALELIADEQRADRKDVR